MRAVVTSGIEKLQRGWRWAAVAMSVGMTLVRLVFESGQHYRSCGVVAANVAGPLTVLWYPATVDRTFTVDSA